MSGKKRSEFPAGGPLLGLAIAILAIVIIAFS